MSELLIKRLNNSIGLEGILYLCNGFRFECKILSCDNEFVEIYDLKKSRVKIIKISEISEVDLNGY
jgi:hypothetical protein